MPAFHIPVCSLATALKKSILLSIYQLIESTNIKDEAANTEESNTSKSTKQVIFIKYTPKKQTKEASPVAKKSAAAAVLTVKSDTVRQSNKVEDATTLLAAPMSSTWSKRSI